MISPGGTIGILGSGQLGRMTIIAARRLGFKVHIYSPDADSPAGQICDRAWVGSFSDEAKLQEFAKSVQIVTFEFENIPASALEIVAGYCPVAPSTAVLKTAQHRIKEKLFLKKLGIPVADFLTAETRPELLKALASAPRPCVLKSAMSGYDGKGQWKIDLETNMNALAETVPDVEYVIEQFVALDKEISVIIARSESGEMKSWQPFENIHHRHILDTTLFPARISEELKRTAQIYAEKIAEALELVGLLCVEFFVTKDGALLVNELAPRPHNSGHITIECAATSQFEQLLRAISGMPLGETNLRSPGVMCNLLGDLWESGEPDWELLEKTAGVSLHLYGKKEAKIGRKMGHFTVQGSSADEALRRVAEIKDAL